MTVDLEPITMGELAPVGCVDFTKCICDTSEEIKAAQATSDAQKCQDLCKQEISCVFAQFLKGQCRLFKKCVEGGTALATSTLALAWTFLTFASPIHTACS